MNTMRFFRRILLLLLVAVVILALGAGGFGYYTLRKPLPQTSGTLTLAGLGAPVEIYRDSAGVPHIYADTTADLMFALGVVHAQDRWWQMEFNRHVALGRISELVGMNKSVLASDTFIRTVGWNRTAQLDLDATDPATRTVIDDYARGVNAYIKDKQGGDLAIEYSLLGVQGVKIPVEVWTALDSVAWGNALSWDLSGNYGDELDLADLYRKFGDKADMMIADYVRPYPYDHAPTIVTAADLPITAQPVQTTAITPIRAEGLDLGTVQTALVGGALRDVNAGIGHGVGIGSNNWVVAGSHTVSGKPLLANDPHISISMPSIWYQVGLHCRQMRPECPYEVQGFSFPGVPAVVIGHNDRIAWGVTNVGPDVQDLYAIKVDPADNTKYIVDDKTETMQVLTETIKFGDDTPSKDIQVRVTRFGPIITDASKADDGRALALKYAVAAQPKNIIGSALAIDRATDWNSFRAAVALWTAPAQNFIYADVDGNIGYQTPGNIPIRAAGHTGLVPVDGSTTRYDWKGYIPFELLPRAFNPAKGYIESANQAVVPPEYYTALVQTLGDKFGADSNYLISYTWAYGNRARRISDLLEATPKQSRESFAAIQGDDYSFVAADTIPTLATLDYKGTIPSEAIAWLVNWDKQSRMDSGPAALWNTFWVELCKDLWGDQLGYTPYGGGQDAESLRYLMTQPDNIWWDDITTADVKETRDTILVKAMIDAYKSLTVRLSPDYKTWTWGQLHTATFVSNPLGLSGIDLIEKLVNGGPVPVSGGTDLVNATNWSADDAYYTSSAPSMRMIVDMADFDNSQWIHTTGQSGHPLSAHYRDQIDLWRMIQYNPMLWTASKVQGQAGTEKLLLKP